MSIQHRTKKFLISIGIAAVSLSLPAFVSYGKNKNNSFPNYAMYTKENDRELHYLYFPEGSSDQISSGLSDEIRYDSDPAEISRTRIARTYQLSQDGRLLFFPDSLDYSCFSLYYKDIDDPNEKAVKIDSGVSSYLINGDASVITYEKNDELCQYNRKTGKRKTIADNIWYYYVSEDNNTILYRNARDIFYCSLSDGSLEKVDIHPYDMNCLSKDLSTIYYISYEGAGYTLCKKERGKEDVKIDFDIWKIIRAYDSGELYYVTVDSVDFPLMSYVYDAKKEADAVLTKPVLPDRNMPDYDTAYRAYIRSSKEYRAKLKRDEIREYLEEAKRVTYSFSHYALYYYDGKKSTLISNSFTDFSSSYSFAADKPVITYTQHNMRDDAGVDLSEIEDADKIVSTVSDSICSVDRYIAFGASVIPLGHANGENTECCLSADGNTFYYLEETPKDNDYGNLYQMDISSPERLGAPKLYDEDVFCNNFYDSDSLFYVGKDNLLYFKNYRENKGELYVNRRKMDDDVNRIIPEYSSYSSFLQR